MISTIETTKVEEIKNESKIMKKQKMVIKGDLELFRKKEKKKKKSEEEEGRGRRRRSRGRRRRRRKRKKKKRKEEEEEMGEQGD